MENVEKNQVNLKIGDFFNERLDSLSRLIKDEYGTENYYKQEIDYIRKQRDAILQGKSFKDLGRKPKHIFVSTFEPNFDDFEMLKDTEQNIRCRKCGNPVMFIFNNKKVCIQCIENSSLKMLFRMIYSLKFQMDLNYEQFNSSKSHEIIAQTLKRIEDERDVKIEKMMKIIKAQKTLIDKIDKIIKGMKK